MSPLRAVAHALLLGTAACSSSGSGSGGCPPDSGTCGLGGTGTGGFGNTGNTGGVGNTGNTGGVGNTGNTGGVGNTGNTGNIGGVGNTGNTGGVGNTGNTGGVGNTGNTGGTGGGLNPNLGKFCLQNGDCGLGLSCVAANSGVFDGAGPAKGLCTADCSSSDAICTALDPTAICREFTGSSYCMEGCEFGPATLNGFDPEKCHGREEMACAPFFDSADQFVGAACAPQCNSDQDCGGGLKCSPKTGLCSVATATGLALGQTCTVPTSGGVDSCKGTCTNFTHQNGQVFLSMCTEACTLGAQPACGWTGSGTGPAPAACLFVSKVILDNGGAGLGDLGGCGVLCDCNSQCNPALVCSAWTGANAQATKDYFQRNGYCTDPENTGGPPDPGISCP